jgi:ribonuclease HII
VTTDQLTLDQGAWAGSDPLALDAYFRARLGASLCGLDEAGRGPLAGPVVAGAVIFLPQTCLPGLDDSKKLSPAQRETFYGQILACAAAWAVGQADHQEIDRLNILEATRLAMWRAIQALPSAPDALLIDGLRLPAWSGPQRALIKGDARSHVIAAASVLAKVTRDRLMAAFDRQYPGYGFSANKGYPTPAHKLALCERGPCPIHRRTFHGVKELPLPPAGGRR